MERLRNQIDKNMIKDKVILDVGTGPKSIEFLISCGPAKIYAVSYNPNEITESQKVQAQNSTVKYIEWDLSSDKNLNIEKVDVIFAGYFLPALEGSRPGRLLDALKRIKKLLKDNGIVIVEDFYWISALKAEQDKLAKELYQITFDSKDLAGITYPVQMSETQEIKTLKKAGFHILGAEKGIGSQNNANFLNMHEHRLSGLKNRVGQLKDKDKLQGEQMIRRAEYIVQRLREINIPPVFSYDYIIIAKN